MCANGTELFGDIPSHQANTAIDDNTNQDHQGYHTHHGYDIGHMQKGSTSPEILKVQDAHQPGSLNFPQGLLALVTQLLRESLQQIEVFDKEVHESPSLHGYHVKLED